VEWLDGLARDLRTLSGRFPEVVPYADFFEAVAAVRPTPGGVKKLEDALDLTDNELSSWDTERDRRTGTLREAWRSTFGYVRPAVARLAGGNEAYVEYLGPNLQRLESALASVDPTELKRSAAMGRALEQLADGRAKVTPALRAELRSAAAVTPGGWGAVIERYLESLG
jgi:hypothetical protein